MPGENNDKLAVIEGHAIQAAPTVPRLVAFVEDVDQAMSAVRTLHSKVLRDGIDYGVIPGTGDKPCLLKPGAESLLMAFQLGVGEPEIERVAIEAPIDGHCEYRVRLPIIHRPTAQVIGYGVGSCSTMEKKYRYRHGERKCPECGQATIIKGKAEYGGGWLCFKKKGGCGAKFNDKDPTIVDQDAGQVENQDPADQYNTCLKMAKKRALIDGALTSCAASGVFTQDVEEHPGYVDPEPIQHPPNGKPAPNHEDLQPPLLPIPTGEMLTVMIGRGQERDTPDGPAYVWLAAWKDATGRQHDFIILCLDQQAARDCTLMENPVQYQGYIQARLSHLKQTMYRADELAFDPGPAIVMDKVGAE